MVVDTEGDGDVLAEGHGRQPVRHDEHDRHDDGDDPQDLVLALVDRREGSLEPDGHALQGVRLECQERRDRGDDRAEHHAHDWHEQRGAQGDAAQQREEHHRAHEREDDRAGHAHQDRGTGPHDHDDEQAQTRPLGRACRGGLGETVLGDQLHDEAAHRHCGARQDEGDRARDAHGEENLPPVVLGENRVLAGRQGEDEERSHGERGQGERQGTALRRGRGGLVLERRVRGRGRGGGGRVRHKKTGCGCRPEGRHPLACQRVTSSRLRRRPRWS